MKVPGPKTTFILQAPTQTRTGAGGVTNTWADQVTFQGSLEPLTTAEVNAFNRETEVFTHLSIIGYEEIGDTYASALKAKNRLYAANADNALGAETFDIIGVEPQRFPNNKIATFEVMLRKVE
jgi:head-tail adaptor